MSWQVNTHPENWSWKRVEQLLYQCLGASKGDQKTNVQTMYMLGPPCETYFSPDHTALPYPNPLESLLRKMWSMGQQHQHHVGARQRCSISGPTSDPTPKTGFCTLKRSPGASYAQKLGKHHCSSQLKHHFPPLTQSPQSPLLHAHKMFLFF